MEKDLLLKVNNLEVKIDNKEIIKDISFELRKKEILAIIGPNGGGKTILLKALLGIVPISQGEIYWKPGVKIGYLPQRFQVDHYLPITVGDFLKLNPEKKPKNWNIVKLAGLNEKWFQKKLAHLSGGEIQRVLLSWALLHKPEVLLFDEPTENVDLGTSFTIYHLIHNLQNHFEMGFIIVSHDLNAVYRHANYVLCLNQKMMCYGIPEKELTSDLITKLYGEHHTLFHHHH